MLSVRVCAPMEFRVEQMTERLGVDERNARREIERSDAAHGRTFLRFFEADWRDPVNYDVVLNMVHLLPNVCADMLCETAESSAFEESEATRRIIGDRLIKARISTAMNADGTLERYGRHIRISVEDAEVRLYGIVADGRSRKLAEDIVAAQQGVRNFTNDIVRASGFSE